MQAGWFLKEGVWLPPQLTLLDPDVPFHIKRMLDTAARAAPEVLGGRICCTAIGRKVDEAKFSYHAVGRAVDIRTGLSGDEIDNLTWYDRPGAITRERFDAATGPKAAYWNATQWADTIRLALGDGYDVVYGIERDHVSHIHVERDKRDG